MSNIDNFEHSRFMLQNASKTIRVVRLSSLADLDESLNNRALVSFIREDDTSFLMMTKFELVDDDQAWQKIEDEIIDYLMNKLSKSSVQYEMNQFRCESTGYLFFTLLNLSN